MFIMKIFNTLKLVLATALVFFAQVFLFPLPKARAYSNPAAVPLGTVVNFAALAKTSITSPTGPTVLNNGDLGIASPGTCTDFPTPCSAPNANGTINNGAIQFQNTAATTGQTDATAAVTNIGLRAADTTLAGGLLGGQTLTQGVYEVPAAVTSNLIGDLTLNGDANSVFIFHLTSTLVTSTGSRVLLTGGAQACNVFWKVDSSATFNGTTNFVGTVLASDSVTFPGGAATLNGRVIAQTAAITFNNTTVNNSQCAAVNNNNSSSSSNNSAGNTASAPAPCVASPINTVPLIIESKRVSPTSIYLAWGPFAGFNQFNVQYGFTNGGWLYNTNVTGFSTTINDLPSDQPIWVQVAARDNCSIGAFGEARLVGGPKLPNTGNAPQTNTMPWVAPAGMIVGTALIGLLLQRRFRFFSVN